MIAALLVLSCIDVIYVRAALRQETLNEGRALGSERIYIASIHWNNEAILRSHWIPAVLSLVKEIRGENVFVSIQESGSWDDSKGALTYLDSELEKAGIRRKIILDPTTHLDEINNSPANSGWIMTPRNKMELRRIPYLAGLRNLVLEPLHRMKESGEIFDKILFLNDVVFTNDDVRKLLSTRNGEYAAACSLDFSRPPNFYDTFALRDADGHETLMQTWPFFRARKSRSAMKANRPVPVKSCWNGMVAMDASPFYEQGLAFRGIPDLLAMHHLEGSECCLVHADNPLSRAKGVWLNPAVRVGYSGPAYDTVNSNATWLTKSQILKWSWTNRFCRWFTTTWFKERVVRSRVSAWRREGPKNEEVGMDCIINEMQVLVYNGWAHV